MTAIIYATTNPGKFKEVKKIFAHHGINITALSDHGINIDVEETGSTLEENARLKAEAYLSLLPPDSIVVGDDTGIEIASLGGEPGTKVRRWMGYKMEDEEIIDYCLERMRDVPPGSRQAKFRTVLAVAKQGSPTKYFEGELRGEILLKPLTQREPGMPFWPLFYLPELNQTLGQFHAKPIAFQAAYPTHRELAVLKLLPYLATLNH